MPSKARASGVPYGLDAPLLLIVRLMDWAKSHRRTVAVFLVSAVTHILIFLPWTGASDQAGRFPNLGPAENSYSDAGETIGVSLQFEPTVKETAAIESALSTLSTVEPEPLESPVTDVAAPTDQSSEKRPSATTALDPANPSPQTMVSGGTGSDGSNGSGLSPLAHDLWVSIEPCWRRLEGGKEPVTLKVSFSALGNIVGQPIIMGADRPKLALPLSKAEARALRALAECGPYMQAYGQTNIDLAFPAE